MPSRHATWPYLLAASVLAVLPAARGDEVVLKDGKTLSGEVTSEDDHSVTIRIADPGSSISLSRKLNKSQVKSVTRPKQEGPAYATLPVAGEIGKDVTAASLQAGFDEAARAKAKYVVLDIDSPGGSIRELIAILDLVTAAQRDREVVAYVRNAYSAAAVLAMSCKQIYVGPRAAIGAAVPYQATPNGPADIEAKFKSAIAAKQRAYVVAAGHDPLFLQGMMEMDVEIHLDADPAGKPVLTTDGGGKIIKAKGAILTLTGAEAAESGLARVAADLSDVGRQVTGGAWHEPTRRPWDMTVAAAASRHRAEREGQVDAGGRPAGRAALARVKPELSANGRRIKELSAKLEANSDAYMGLRRDAESTGLRIAADYHAALAKCTNQAEVAHAKDVRDGQIATAMKSAEEAADKLKGEGDRISAELKQLRARQKELLATLPTD